MIRICQCGLATNDPGLLEDHLSQYGHRERVPWWDKYTQAVLGQLVASYRIFGFPAIMVQRS